MRTILFKLLLLLVLQLAFSGGAHATHIVGGEMNYKNLGGDNYEIRLTVYRDCYVGVPPFDDPAIIGIFDSNNNFIDSVWFHFRGLDTLPPTINSPCFLPITDFCYEVTTYIDTIYLPPIAGGYTLSYQRCCRNQHIINIVLPEDAGATYWATIPGPEVVAVNSNPAFKKLPPPFICADKPWVFDHSAIDYDGDSLSYELMIPYNGLSPNCPSVGPVAGPGCPQQPTNPPFFPVTWETGFDLTNVLGGVPMAIDPVSGIITATPNTLGYFVYGVKCKEYRNGVLLSQTIRDYQLIVKDCPSFIVASAVVPNIFCGNSAKFTNKSTGAVSYTWDFGDLSTLADSSHVENPSYTYPGLGDYEVTLVAHAENGTCTDTTRTTVHLEDHLKGYFEYTSEPCFPNKMFFKGSTNAPSGVINYEWHFGDTTISGLATEVISNASNSGTYANPAHVYPPVPYTHPVTLIVRIAGVDNCKDSLSTEMISIDMGPTFFVPNSFTPNSDGKNDVFRVRGAPYTSFYFAVYDRWGELVFETENPKEGWDGTFKGEASNPGVFGYYVRARCGEEKEEIFWKGNVTLIR